MVGLRAIRPGDSRAHGGHRAGDDEVGGPRIRQRRFACDREGDGIDALQLVETPEVLEQQRTAREGIGGDDFGAGLEIEAVRLAHDGRVGEVGLRAPERGAHGRAEALDLGADPAIEQHHPAALHAREQAGVGGRAHARMRDPVGSKAGAARRTAARRSPISSTAKPVVACAEARST